MPSFDIVSKVDMAEVRNAVTQALKEISQRYDFKGSKSEIREEKDSLLVISDDEGKLKAVKEILLSKLTRRGVDIQNLELGKTEPGSGQTVKQTMKILQGIPQEQAKEISKAIRDSQLKVQAQIQGDQLRVSGKKKDDLQQVMGLLRGRKNGVGLQFVNFRD
jgi:hypothetical protein